MQHLTTCSIILFLLVSVQAVPGPVLKNSRIFGGEEAEPHSIPYIAYLKTVVYETAGVKRAVQADGVLITPNAILTVADTFLFFREFLRVEIYLGAQHVDSDPDTDIVRISSRSEVVLHPNFTLDHIYVNNIAICRFEEPVELNDIVNVVPLPFNPDNDYVGELATVSGWGGDETSILNSDSLRKMEVEVIPNEECDRHGDDVLCTSQEGGKSVCSIDKGGPLVSSAGELIGMVVSGIFCEDVAQFGTSLYARITSHLRWIAQNV